MRTEQQEGPTSFGSLYLLGVSDLAVQQLTTSLTLTANGLIQGPASWAPDGRAVAYAAKDPITDTTSILLSPPAAGAKAAVLIPDAPGATSARFSPNGSLIAFDQASATGFHDLYVVKPDGSGLVNLTADFNPGVCCAQWSPDGRALLVAGTASDDDHNNVFVVAADGPGLWQVTNDANAYTDFLWGPDFR